MENKPAIYITNDYRILKAFLCGITTLFLMTALILYLGKLLQSPFIGIVGWILICTVPFFFQKRFKRAFSLRTELTFNSQSLSVKQYTKNGDLSNEMVIAWSNIKSYRVQFMQNDVFNLNLALRDNSKKSFYFIDEKHSDDDAPSEINVYNLFVAYVREYNADKSVDQKILTKRSVLTSATAEL